MLQGEGRSCETFRAKVYLFLLRRLFVEWKDVAVVLLLLTILYEAYEVDAYVAYEPTDENGGERVEWRANDAGALAGPE